MGGVIYKTGPFLVLYLLAVSKAVYVLLYVSSRFNLTVDT